MNQMTDEVAELAAARHFRLHLQQAVLALVVHGTRATGSIEGLIEAYPFLAGYMSEMAENGLDGVSLDEAGDLWRRSILAWEHEIGRRHLPLRALREALDLDAEDVDLLMMIGLIEDDIRFAALFARFGGCSETSRPALGLLAAVSGAADAAVSRQRLQSLFECGLVSIGNVDAPASAWVPSVPLAVWEVLRGDTTQSLVEFEYQPAEALPALDELILPASLQTTLARLLPMLQGGEAGAVVLRGPRHNGRRTVLKALARALGYGVIGAERRREGSEAERRLGLMATLLNAMPMLAIDAAPGETVELPGFSGWDGPIGIALGREGGLSGERIAAAVTLTLPIPDAAGRRRLWTAHGDAGCDDVGGNEIPDLRMTSGHIRRAVKLAQSYAALDGCARAGARHRLQAARSLGQESLDGLASRVSPLDAATEVVLTADTAEEFAALTARCRSRERLGGEVGPAFGAQLGVGVRAMFRGPSGCGKTLAARRLAALLGRELYRVDLAAVINKYIGETEKKLARVLDRAEEVDAVLLFDEGDALMGKRTAVQSSTDRYSNLETNFLLQRLDEDFGGILIVTTNASDQIDTAFRRRMDAVIDFRLPDALERQTLWRLHLPQTHRVDEEYLSEASFRCAFVGGQIRNAVLHAALLAMRNGVALDTACLDAAIRREYRKNGAVCPLRGAPIAGAGA